MSLSDKEPMATLPVTDLAAARAFYEGKLGLTALPVQMDNILIFTSGRSQILVYLSQNAGTNQATAITWNVGEDLEAIVADLRAKGVTFEHYDLPGAVLHGDIHHIGPVRDAWCKDPAGNIISLVNG